MGILKILTILCLLAIPVGELGRYILPTVGNAPLVLNDILVGVTVAWWFGVKLEKKEKIQGKLLLPIVLFLAVCILSLLFNSFVLSPPQMFVSSLYILRWGMYAGLYFVIRDFDKEFKTALLYVLLGVGQVVVGIGYLQYFFYYSLRNLYYLGWDEHLYRMFSLFLDPNFAGVFFVLVFILTLFFVIENLQKRKYVAAVLFGIPLLLDLCAVYLTYSRSAFLMLMVSSVAMLILLGKKKFIFVVLGAVFIGLFLSPKSFQTEGTNILRITSSEARIDSAKSAIAIFEKNPILGVGFNAYRYAQNRYGYLIDRYWRETHAGAGTDNSYLFVLATTGIIGFAVYVYLVIRMGQVCLAKGTQKLIRVTVFSSLIGVSVSALFINSFFYIFIMEWLWILLGLMENTSRE